MTIVSVYVFACVRVCVFACVRLCLRVCACICECAFLFVWLRLCCRTRDYQKLAERTITDEMKVAIVSVCVCACV